MTDYYKTGVYAQEYDISALTNEYDCFWHEVFGLFIKDENTKHIFKRKAMDDLISFSVDVEVDGITQRVKMWGSDVRFGSTEIMARYQHERFVNHPEYLL